jgi:hypothetical protein
LATANRAVTTEAPHWRYSRRGGIPEGARGSFNEAATVTLCLRQKASHFCKILSAFSSDGPFVERSCTLFGPQKVRCGAGRLQLGLAKVSGLGFFA